MLLNPASFRDPSGFVFTRKEETYRAIAPLYFENLALLHSSGLYKKLTEKKLLVSHAEEETNLLPDEFKGYKVIKPQQIPFISYPYEWCFGQIKEAALLTLDVLQQSLSHNMILKDATAYNVQFTGYQPIFIDTLSFEKYEEGKPWIAYKQFCQHFLAPLALMSYKLPELSGLLKNHLDGIPLDISAELLPRRALLNSGIATHIILHAKFQQKNAGSSTAKVSTATLSKKNLLAMASHLRDCIEGLSIKEKKSTWSGYENNNSYSEGSQKEKERLIASWLQKLAPKTTWDIGCNTGHYSKIAAAQGSYVLSMDLDFYCIEALYQNLKKTKTAGILPLWNEFSNPSPGLGWANRERKTMPERSKANLILALALVHHLRIGNNVPLQMIAEHFSKLTEHLIIEFVPKTDPMVKQMLASREDIFSDYTADEFARTFKKHFHIHESTPLPGSDRILFRMTSAQQ